MVFKWFQEGGGSAKSHRRVQIALTWWQKALSENGIADSHLRMGVKDHRSCRC